MYGDPLRLVNGYDSFGNVCGSSNADMADHNDSRMSLSGYDTTDRRYVAFININPFYIFVIVISPPTHTNIIFTCLLLLIILKVVHLFALMREWENNQYISVLKLRQIT